MATSDLIASFILDALEHAGGSTELHRSNLADMFNCVPSQINYVISTRFSPEHGYVVESRRGGSGYIRIKRVCPESKQLIMHTVNAVGEKLDQTTVEAFVSNIYNAGMLDLKSARLILSATGNNALRPVEADKRDAVRASIFKQMLINTISE